MGTGKKPWHSRGRREPWHTAVVRGGNFNIYENNFGLCYLSRAVTQIVQRLLFEYQVEY
jgi:hypothetical protein